MLENYQSPWMDEELVIMRDAVRKFLDKEFVPLAEKWDKQGFVDRDAWYKAGEAGILCASISEEYGGGGGDFRHEMVLIEEFNRANISGFGNGVHSGIVAHYIEKYGTQEQKAKWLPKMVSGEIVSAIAMSEPGTGSDLQAVKTSALADGDDYVLNGQKNVHHQWNDGESYLRGRKNRPG
jgi:acyl-CoA dehydrogenase